MISAFSNFPFVEAGFYNAKESIENPPPFLMDQVHSADVVILNESPAQPLFCDALVTRQNNLQLTIKTADCAPVLFLDPEAKIIGATHAGWKGAFQGILENTVLTMLSLGAKIEHIQATIGPHLTQNNFQVSDSMKNLFPKTEHIFFSEKTDGIYFDFSGYIIHRLTRIGLQNVEISNVDTYTDLTYNSYRRDPANPARQYSFIKLK